ncbi:DUF4212 domain-containing protein [Dasania sp. GY-MA-18]|uniref:DUF4212 domain-containing protein n=1 Tax=Dasania phycosphaerae TaxID=2950436 RepID=A0A9J6RIR8_9GAMM|nr:MULTISPECIES: DUF4212 domain-containing protein [Dasania]MCR8921449.1 DUF4212 domain-containing protein [Dasania sp. GY-MA-18]MCZ0863877.1 DUF4212 domain-containing protein [Dasania phycosphaerae]MCZ0867605.1 DUF4212 domain-containing protein [Dasania phycosphaerae]
MSLSDEAVSPPTPVENPTRPSSHDSDVLSEKNLASYWRANRIVLATLLSVWAIITFGFATLLGPWLDQFHLGGFPLGFWFSQQGAILAYVALIFIYHCWMLRIERAHGVDDDAPGLNKGGK